MKQIFCLLISLSFSIIIWAQDQVAFFVQAHADDWQLFMSKNIEDDISFAKIVIVTLTAGDAGHGSSAYGKGKIPYYMARERGAVYSSKFACDISATEVNVVPTCQICQVNGHKIARYVYKDHIINYFLRLPDGLSGEGLPSTGNQSLQKLKEGKLTTLTAVDNSAVYNGWTDLTQTLKTLFTSERGNDEQVWINTHSADLKYNEGDHSDHYSTALAVLDATAQLNWTGIVSWMGYRSRKLPANLTTKEIISATSIFSAYTWSLMENGYGESFDNAHRRFLPCDYSIIVKRPVVNSFSERIMHMIKSLKRKFT